MCSVLETTVGFIIGFIIAVIANLIRIELIRLQLDFIAYLEYYF